MFHGHDSTDTAPGDSSSRHQSVDDRPEFTNNDRINNLNKARRQDQFDEFREEREVTRTSKRKHESDDEEYDETDWVQPAAKVSSMAGMSVAQKLMAKMGHVEGTGLGKNKQGISEPVGLSTQRGTAGFGSSAGKAVARDFNETWDDTDENKTVEENVSWFTACDDQTRKEICDQLEDDKWIVIKPKKMKIEDETEFCDEQVLLDMLKAKDVFDAMSDRDLREARTRANPYETIGKAFFQNRAAMKTANMDKIYDWILSRENTKNDAFLAKNPLDSKESHNIDRNSEIFYFADVCAGPGGFSEYMLWRKGFYNAKGFGFTLTGKDDFKLNKFMGSSAFYFEPFYGTKNNGDVMDPENIEALENFIMKGTNNCGVHLMMADGGFSVEGQENLQEVLSKRLYLCQLLVSLCICREGGNFFCKLFDIFTPFSVALIYLMRICYDEISLHKPHTSRPANSERYITCKGLRKEYSDVVRDYLKRINRKLDVMKEKKDQNDILEIVPLDILKNDQDFYNDIVVHNENLAKRQTLYLRKYQSFAKNQGQFDKDQGTLREECLKYWMVPNRQPPREKDRGRDLVPPLHLFGNYATKLVGEADFSIRPPEFNISFLKSSIPSNITYCEYQMVRMANTQLPVVLISTPDATFLNEHGRFMNFSKLEMRIPENTIMLVEVVQPLKKENKQKLNSSPLIRILDAAVLNGDVVAALPYSERMKAAAKFATALTLVNKTVKTGWGRGERTHHPHCVTAARVFDVEEIDEFKEGIEQAKGRAEVVPYFEENGYCHFMKGVRFVRVLSPNWMMGWSKSQQKPYAHSAEFKNQGSLMEHDWQAKGCYASFWDTAVTTNKERTKIDELLRATQGFGTPVPSMIWKWNENYNNGYGASKILNEPEEYKGETTLGSLKKHVAQTDETCNRRR